MTDELTPAETSMEDLDQTQPSADMPTTGLRLKATGVTLTVYLPGQMREYTARKVAEAIAKERERCASAVMAQVEVCAEHTYGYTREAAIAFCKEDKFDSHCAQAEEILAIAARAIKKG